MVSYVLAVDFGSGWLPLGRPVEVEVCSLGALFGSTTVCCYHRSVLENNVKGGSCGYGNSGISAVGICEASMLGMLGEIAVGLAGLVQFGEAGTLVLE